MDGTKFEEVWSLDAPEWINFFNNDVFLDYKEFVSRKLPLKYPSLSASRSSRYHPGPYYSFDNQRGDNDDPTSYNIRRNRTKRMVGCQKLCRLLWLLSCIMVLLGILGIIFVTIFIIINDRDKDITTTIETINTLVYSTVAPTYAPTAPPTAAPTAEPSAAPPALPSVPPSVNVTSF